MHAGRAFASWIWLAIGVAVTAQYIIMLGVGLFAGSLVQSSVGFGFGLVSIPLLIWAGLPLPVAIATASTGSLTQCCWACYHNHQHLAWRGAGAMTLMRLVSLPIGLWLLTILVSIPRSQMKQVVGAVLLGLLLLRWLCRIKPRAHVARGWDITAAVSSGVLLGMVGMGGPPMVLWIMAHDWPSTKARSFMWAMVLMTGPVFLGILIARYGSPVAWAVLIAAAYLPLILLGSQMGMRLGERLSRQWLRYAMTVVLVAVGVVSVARPLWSHLWG